MVGSTGFQADAVGEGVFVNHGEAVFPYTQITTGAKM